MDIMNTHFISYSKTIFHSNIVHLRKDYNYSRGKMICHQSSLSHICINNNDLNDSFAVQSIFKNGTDTLIIHKLFKKKTNPVLLGMYITECFFFPSTFNSK